METGDGAVELVIPARTRDIGGFAVGRVLPAMGRRLVGPFIFFDHMGPVALPVGTGVDVGPHPHIGLATVTYLFEGDIDHRDGLGTMQTIRPGDVNWMVAGSGLAHSERSGAASRARGVHIHGIQSWVALPTEHEEVAPRFEHHPASTLPRVVRPGAVLDVIAGTAFGVRAPVEVFSPTLYVHGRLDAGARLPLDTEHEERALYVVEGSVRVDGHTLAARTMAVLHPGRPLEIEALEPTRLMIVGGAPLGSTRNVFWNFVSSSKERIERAKADWKEGRFAAVPGDPGPPIPLPER